MIDNPIKKAGVTGATGMIGKRIVRILLDNNIRVKILSRRFEGIHEKIEAYKSSLGEPKIIREFVSDTDVVFHCAAELNDESKMWKVNLDGTKNLIDAVREASIQNFCYISSAGVIGKTSGKWVTENSPCEPQNTYERSKLAAENLIRECTRELTVVIMRPTNVVDGKRPGAVSLPMDGSLKSKMTVFLKGAECAHLIHAHDVAHAAVSMIQHAMKSPHNGSCQTFFVSCDHEKLNTYAGVWSLYHAVKHGKPDGNVRPLRHLPLIFPYLMRRTYRGKSNRGNVRYSSEKLFSTGYRLPLGLKGAIQNIIRYHSLV